MSIYQQGSYAGRYDEEKFGGAFGRYLREQEVKTYLAWVPADARTVLDVGAGTGKLALPLAARGHAVTALDASEAMLEVARRQAEKRGIALQTVVADAQALPFEDQRFDWVVCSRLLMHLGDWERALAQLCRVASCGVVFDFQPRASFSGLHARYKQLKRRWNPDIQAFNALPVGNVLRVVERQGGTVVRTMRGFFLPLFLHRRLDQPQRSAQVERTCRRLGLTRGWGAPVIVQAIKGMGSLKAKDRGDCNGP